MMLVAATTKMRDEKPEDYEAKVLQYKRIGAKMICEHSIPKELVYGADETNVLFVQLKQRTRATKGQRRVKLLGLGKDKAQITVTLCGKEGDGKILGAQYIFGGTTNRCHPKGILAPQGSYFDHTKSHWQTPDSFSRWIEKILIPDIQSTKQRLGLPTTQKAMLKIDLHYSHFEPKVLEKMQQNHILPNFVPAKCTDAKQEMDICVNKTFKCGLKNEFQEHLHQDFNKHLANGGEPATWSFNFNTGNLKPHIVKFVEAGLSCLRTPEFAETLMNCFAKDGDFEEMRGEEMQAWARQSLAQTTAQEDIEAFVQAGPTPEEEAEVFGVGAMAEAIDGVAAEVEQVEVDDLSELQEDDSEVQEDASEDEH